ncbi:Cys-tRNA(Pro) deacylase [Sulfurimonas lithotrophica]|uniref:Cys-tRNA(Pro)/Cys-tRNA(Cys) deacylase n=1 Tax=Sulfurimonas lithotrophica TaxID=2590022 RepID=A0A5P8P1W9_9BACT|nr:Cys-tRNA(Pro) deacylase [Sulfurimonas lithotrophica]QFR49674.1 Cys-tRNA(Pro) deacylase [Sulfurimonas lithotrophica]
MTPSIKLLKKTKTNYKIHQFEHDSSYNSYGVEASQKLGVDEQRVFKTLVVQSDKGEFIVGIIPVSSKLSMKSLAKAAGMKKVAMADTKDVEKITGYIIGGVSPLGQKKRLKTFIDKSAQIFETIFVSAGKRGLEVELDAKDLQALLNAKFENIIS